MLASRLALGYGAELAVYLALAAFLLTPFPGLVAVALALAAALAMRALTHGVVFALSWRHRAERPAPMCVGALRAAAMVLTEFGALIAVYWALQPFERWLGQREPAPAAGSPHPPVLLVHGYMCNGGFWWPLRRYLNARGVTTTFTINLEPPEGDIDDFGQQLGRRVEEVRRATGAAQVVLVCHSMGGLVARAYLRQPGAGAAVRKLVTLGTPHHGTVLARLARGVDAGQMRRHSAWLARLNAQGPPPVPCASIFSHHDNIVMPQDSSVLAGARNIPLAGIGHVQMTFSRRVQALVYDEVVSS